jgi:hypothetical protein
MTKMGRPSALTDEFKSQLKFYILNANPVKTSVQAAGVSPKTFYGWQNEAKAEKERKAEAIKNYEEAKSVYASLDASEKTKEKRVHLKALKALTETDPQTQAYIELFDLIPQWKAQMLGDVARRMLVLGDKDFRALNKILEKHDPEHWGPSKEEVNGTGAILKALSLYIGTEEPETQETNPDL